MKRFASKLFSKVVIIAVIICVQFAWLAYLLCAATIASSTVDIIFRICSIILVVHIANKDIRTSFKMSWTVLILFLPQLGILAYFIFGRSDLTKRARLRLIHSVERNVKFRTEEPEVKRALYVQCPDAGMQSDYITNWAGYPLYCEGDTTYYPCIEEMFPQYLEDLESAQHFIFLEYFIVSTEEMFSAVLDILERKIAEGVEVRLLYDDIGSINYVPTKFYKTMQEKGINCVRFNPFRPLMSIIMNNRDHRKIMVVDGKVAYTGGFNLSDEYINVKCRYGYWKDAGIRMTGDCVWSFTSMFIEMWEYATRTDEDALKYKVQCEKSPTAGRGFIQPYADSPMNREYVAENVYLNLINHAKKYVYIFTPYLIISSEISTALENAAKSGVDVRITVPGVPDKMMVYWLTKSSFAGLIKAGVKIYQYTFGFIHSKCFVVDDAYAAVGTINLDYRSLCLHFECGTFMYRTDAVMQVRADMLDTMAEAHLVTLEEADMRFVRIILGVLKLLAPLL